MRKRTVLDVGNCRPDYLSIKRMLTNHFDVDVLQSHAWEDTLALLRGRSIDLVLINRKLDQDYTDGIEVLRRIKAEPEVGHVPVMIVSNHVEQQEVAMALGAERGFGKLELDSAATHEKLSHFLQCSDDL